MPKKTRRVLTLGDFHCGHVAGLTPPHWQRKAVVEEDDVTTKWNKWCRLETALWAEWTKIRKKIGKVDVLLVNGDCIDGRGERSGGTELITTNRTEQCDMAEYIIRQVGADKVIMTYGTAYHSGGFEDWEDAIATNVGADKIGAHEWFDVNGLIFDAKHKIGTSAIPHGRYTAIAKARVWNVMWAERNMQPKADIIIRSHAHFFSMAQDSRSMAIILPALQGMGSKFGARICEGTVDWGVCWFDVTNKNDWTFHKEIREIEAQKTEALVL